MLLLLVAKLQTINLNVRCHVSCGNHLHFVVVCLFSKSVHWTLNQNYNTIKNCKTIDDIQYHLSYIVIHCNANCILHINKIPKSSRNKYRVWFNYNRRIYSEIYQNEKVSIVYNSSQHFLWLLCDSFITSLNVQHNVCTERI